MISLLVSSSTFVGYLFHAKCQALGLTVLVCSQRHGVGPSRSQLEMGQSLQTLRIRGSNDRDCVWEQRGAEPLSDPDRHRTDSQLSGQKLLQVTLGQWSPSECSARLSSSET